MKALQAHQAESQKNMQAENQRIRKDLWGYQEPQEGEDVNSQTILGDVTHPTPIIINGQQQQSGGVLKTLAILAAGALIPGAGIGGYLASQWMNKKPVATETEDKSLDLGLLKFEDLKQQEPQQ